MKWRLPFYKKRHITFAFLIHCIPFSNKYKLNNIKHVIHSSDFYTAVLV